MRPTIHAIDPGPTRSAFVTLRPDFQVVSELGPNADVLESLRAAASQPEPSILVIEQIASYGMPVGAEVFETVFWSGRFAEAWERRSHTAAHRLPRLAVKVALCHDSRAKDANIRQALIDQFGGPACIRKGGPLYGVKGDMWAALAVAIAFSRTKVSTHTTTHQSETHAS